VHPSRDLWLSTASASPAAAIPVEQQTGKEGFIDKEWKCWQFRLVLYMQAASQGQESDRHNGKEKLLLESFLLGL